MHDGARFRANSPSVIHETIENEVIIVNLDSGSYYSLDQFGAQLWNYLSSGLSVSEVRARLAQAYEAESSALDDALDSFVAELQTESLIVPLAQHAPRPDAGDDEPPLQARRAFEPPHLNKYTDMQDLLLLDPIHEVDETGWPQAKPLSTT